MPRYLKVSIALLLGIHLLSQLETTKAADNLIPNSSVENSANNIPDFWHQGYLWGDLDAQYQYLNTGYQGGHSLRATVTRYVSGDAKWYFTPQTITGGQTYRFTDYYLSDITSHVVVQTEHGDGTITYFSLQSASPATSWTPYSADFTTPATAKFISVFHLISAVGSLTTDEFSLTELGATNGFNRGLASVTFDDGWQSIHQNALPLLGQYSIPSTQYIATGLIGSPGYMSRANVIDFFVLGHQIASHTVHHFDLTTLGLRKLIDELRQSRTYLERLTGGSVTSLAAPYGAYNQATISQIKKYYSSQRTSDIGFNTKTNFNKYQLRSQHLTPSVTTEEYRSWLTTALSEKSWLILMYHNVDSSGSAYSVTPETLAEQLAAIQESGIPTKTIDQALLELIAQL